MSGYSHISSALISGIIVSAFLETINFNNQAICNCYTMGCLPVRGDNPRALAS